VNRGLDRKETEEREEGNVGNTLAWYILPPARPREADSIADLGGLQIFEDEVILIPL
jgi:hypothetical protein